MQYTDYNDDTLEHIQKVELMILKDFIKICEENNLEYYSAYGTTLGAIRHNGFIPWDDDIDVMMFREDYEKFLKITEEKLSDKYEILNFKYQKDYFFLFSRMSLNDTYFEEVWSKQVDFNLGIHIDIFILDKVPKNSLKRFYQVRKARILDRLLTMATIKIENYPKSVMIIANTIHSILKIFKIKPEYFFKKSLKTITKYENTDTDLVYDFCSETIELFEIDDFKPPKKVKFEDIEVNVPNNYDKVLSKWYGNYMELPPEDERRNHILNKLDFGKY